MCGEGGMGVGRGGGLFLQEPHVWGAGESSGGLVTAEYLLTKLPSDSNLHLLHQDLVTCTFPDKVPVVFPGKLMESRQQAELSGLSSTSGFSLL